MLNGVAKRVIKFSPFPDRANWYLGVHKKAKAIKPKSKNAETEQGNS